MVQPPGYETGGANIVCHLQRSLYGLKQAPRAWYARLKTELEHIGFTASLADAGLFIMERKTSCTYLIVHVDDILIAGDSDGITYTKTVLKKVFELRDMGDSQFYLGMELSRDREQRTLRLTQQRYTSDLLAKYNLTISRIKDVPMSTCIKLTKDAGDLLKDDDKLKFTSLVGGLLYLSVCTRPDIAQAVGGLTRFMSCPTSVHYEAAKTVLRYIAGTSAYGITFNGTEQLLGYCDADYGGDIDSRRSTTGYLFIFCGAAVSWSSRLQPTVAASTTQAEYMAAAAAVKESLWMRKLLPDFGVPIDGPIHVKCDNQGTIALLKNPIETARAKHIDVIHHFARERVARKEIEFSYISTDRMVADCLTKPLPASAFKLCRDGMGIRP